MAFKKTKVEIPTRSVGEYGVSVVKLDNGYLATVDVRVLRHYNEVGFSTSPYRDVQQVRKFFPTEQEAAQFIVDTVAETIGNKY